MDAQKAIAARPKVPPDLYRPIEDWQTRLLKLLPLSGDSDSKVQCSLYVVDLVCIEGVVISGTKQQVEYEALSYSWGRKTPTHVIRCNNKRCVVSQQLEEALRALCHHEQPRWIWCDAFCINQHDEEEQSKQVQKMQTIFGKAQKVVVWLGPPQVTSRIAQALAAWTNQARQNDTRSKDHRHLLREEVALAIGIYDCPWITRTWVRQEIQAARQIAILSDYPDVLTWDNLAAISAESYEFAAPEPASKRIRSEYKQASVLSKRQMLHPLTLIHYINSPRVRPIQLRNAQHHHLADWITSMTLFETTRPDDQVYGILGLFEPSLRAGHPNDISSLKVNYARPASEMYTEVMQRILMQSQNLAWLEAHVFTPTLKNRQQLPSWVFDWQVPSFEMIATRQSQAYWAASSPVVAHQVRRLEINVSWDSFGQVADDINHPARCTWTVQGTYYRTLDQIHPAHYETRESSFLPPAIYDMKFWRLATYVHSSKEVFKSGYESIFRNFYVVPWAQPGDIIAGLGICPNFFLLRPVMIKNKEYFHYLGRAIAKIATHMLDRSGQAFRGWYGEPREFVLV